MSTFQMTYLAMVIAGMITLMVLLAWAMWHTRERPGDRD